MSKRLGISTDAVATIGDMENDLPMFAKSGVSFAMGNAADNIKQRATHVTDSNEHDGFAAAIETVLQWLGDISEPASTTEQASLENACPPYQAGVKDKSRSSQSLRTANPLLSAGTIGKREPVSDRHSSHEGRLTPARACRGEDGCRLARLLRSADDHHPACGS